MFLGGTATTKVEQTSYVTCDDGRTGEAYGTTDATGQSAYGTLRLSDGSTVKILTGVNLSAAEMANFIAQNRPR